MLAWEDKAIDGAQKLFVQSLGRQGAARQGLAQGGVGGMLDGALAEQGQRRLYPMAQHIPRGDTVLLALRAPALKRVVRRGGAGGAEARGVDQQPQGGEVGIEAVAQDLGQVDLDPGRAGQAEIVAQQPQGQAVGGDAPEAGLLGVEVFLQCSSRVAERRLLPSAKAWCGASRPLRR